MKILLTIHEKFLPDSGSAGSTFRLGQEYEKLGHEVSFFSLSDMPKLQRQLKRFIFPEFVASHVDKLLRGQGLDVVDGSPGDTWVCGMLSQHFGKQRPLVVTRSHGLQHLEHLWCLEEARQGNLELSWFYSMYRGGYLLWEIANSFRWADLAFFLNQREASYAYQNLNIHPEKIHVFPNGMPESFMSLPIKFIHDKKEEIIRIAHIGTYIKRKGIEYSIPALRNILKKYSNVEISFLGTGFSEMDKPEQLVYKNFDSIFHPRIKVIPTYKHETLPILLRNHHIHLFPSLSEGFGKALIEAMACGLAPVTTDADGPMEVVQENHDALILPKGSSEAIEYALVQLIENKSLLKKLRNNAYETAQRYSWRVIAESRILEYEKALNR